MKKLLVFQHSASEPLGVLDPLLRAAGFRVRYVNFARDPDAMPEVTRYDGLVVLGGPMHADQAAAYPHLAVEIEALRAAVEREMPVLGICLGAQLLAAALGAPVRAHSVREIGWYPLHLTPSAGRDRLLGSFVSGRPVFQWHAYTFDLPRDAMLLASTETCANQAFRYGERTYGLQFHLEADEALIRRWIEREKMAAAVAERMLDDTQRHVGATRMLAERVFSEFVGLFDWRPRKIFLGAS